MDFFPHRLTGQEKEREKNTRDVPILLKYLLSLEPKENFSLMKCHFF